MSGEKFSLFSVYTDGTFTINIGWNYTELADLEPALKGFRTKVEKDLQVVLDDQIWDGTCPTTSFKHPQLSSLLPDNAKAFKKIISDFVAEVKGLVGES